MKKFLLICCVLSLPACQSAPKVELSSGKGAVVGKVETRAHKEMIKKAKDTARTQSKFDRDEYTTLSGKIRYSDKMVNYDKLDDVYVGLISSATVAQPAMKIVATENGFEPRAIAVRTGDKINITNATSIELTFYVVDPNSDAIEELSPLVPGASGEIAIPMEGLLELAADERDDLIASVLSRRGMQTRRVTSGKYYTFNDLSPGNYQMLFWYWRLGLLERPVTIKMGEVTELNEYLSVDRLIKN
jgi:hypothetical protein